MFEVKITPAEASKEYGIKTHAGVTIGTKKPLDKKNIFKIRQILGTFVDLQKAQEEFNKTTTHKDYVASHNPEEQSKEPAHWKSSARFRETELIMCDLQKQHDIVQISVF